VSGRPRHPIFSRVYTRMSACMEREGGAERRDELLAGLCGRVIEVGAGNGLNFAHYPPEVTGVLAVEPEPYLREAAMRSAGASPVPIEVVDGVADGLPASDESFDAAVASLVLCSVPDQRAALREMHRVLESGGELRFFEHVRADTRGLRRAQHLVDATIWPRLFGGCHTGRDTVAAIEASGFTVERVEWFKFPGSGPTVPTSPHAAGMAVKR
jgi:ubiquinone/menaquinone biosynthesis C-methylase UbiE